MLSALAQMYITLLPAVFSGILNMIWCKSKTTDFLKKPIDAGRMLFDEKRVFGDNKTWKGFLGMIVFGCLFTVLWGFLCALTALDDFNLIYENHPNTPLYNAAIGAAFGFSYALFELPNSFLKRRLNITPGKNPNGMAKAFFIFLDQADSIFGCVLVVHFIHPLTPLFYFSYVLVGAVTHIILNILLYFAHLRKNMF